MYLINTRPDIFFVVNTLRHVHLMVAKHALRYVKGVARISPCYRGRNASLMPIGHKGRFLLMVKCRKRNRNDRSRTVN